MVKWLIFNSPINQSPINQNQTFLLEQDEILKGYRSYSSLSGCNLFHPFAKQMSLLTACTVILAPSMTSDMTQRTNMFAMSAGTGILLKKSTIIASKDNGLTSKQLHEHFGVSKACRAYGVLLLPGSTGITTSCRTTDSMEKLQPSLSAKNCRTAMTS